MNKEVEQIYKDYKREWKRLSRFKRQPLMKKKQFFQLVEAETRRDVHVGVKTYQYQCLCHTSSQGQTPFVSNVLCLREAQDENEQKNLAFIIEEVLKRRIKGVTDKRGQRMAPLFPKLLYYVSDGLNLKKGDPYFYLTELAAKCMTTSMQPDIISEKKNREAKKGMIIPNMGCRSFPFATWVDTEYPITTKFHWQKIDHTNVQYDGAPGKNFNYSRGFGTYSALPEKCTKEDIAINFRGNTGWVKEFKTNDKGEKVVVVMKPKVYGKFNIGVVTCNVPHAALTARKQVNESHGLTVDQFDNKYLTEYKDQFYKVLKERLDICHKALLCRWESVQKIKAKNAPLLWQYGAFARLGEDASIGDYIKNNDPENSSISLGYIGLYETCQSIIGASNTTDDGRKFSKEVLEFMNKEMNVWKQEDKLGYSIYGTPEEALSGAAALALKKDFGLVPNVTDHDYVTNSYHVNPSEEISAWDKLKIEGEYLRLSTGGAVSYIEVPDMKKNPDALIKVIQYMYDNIMYAEVNTKIDTCWNCGYQGELDMVKTDGGNFKFRCPKCGCEDPDKQLVTRRICGYMGVVNSGNTNKGRLADIFARVLHLDSK